MEFLPSRVDKRLEALLQFILTNLDQIDERKLSDPRLAQAVFLLKHREELSEKVEDRLVPRILEDINFILEQDCAKEISELDFNHVHLCTASPFHIFDVDVLLSDDEARLLYHTCEKWFTMPQYARRNIASSLTSPPEIIPIKYTEYVDRNGYKTYGFGKITVWSSELGWSEYAKIEFKEKTNGRNVLKDGKRLKMTGIVSQQLTLAIERRGNVLELDGKEIALVDCGVVRWIDRKNRQDGLLR
jgi:hypothetical protein